MIWGMLYNMKQNYLTSCQTDLRQTSTFSSSTTYPDLQQFVSCCAFTNEKTQLFIFQQSDIPNIIKLISLGRNLKILLRNFLLVLLL